MTACLFCSLLYPIRRVRIPREDNKDKDEEETPVPFVIPITSGKVIKVYDGDTITVQFRLPYEESALYKLSLIHI